jgi:hypothetical protein
MKRKTGRPAKPALPTPENLSNKKSPHPSKGPVYLTDQWLDEVAAGTENGIRDTPAWKAAVRRLGLQEVRRRLRLGCLASQCPEANSEN